MTMVLLGLLVFASSAAIDFAHAKYAYAREAGCRWCAAGWSIVQWSAASVGFVVAVRVSLWLLPAEALGLACGTLIAVKPTR